eukprot:Clim_evm15s203 gene=Clim_evmTU15s203
MTFMATPLPPNNRVGTPRTPGTRALAPKPLTNTRNTPANSAKKRKPKPKPAWDSTTTDQSKYALTPEERRRRHEVHQSNNIGVARMELRAGLTPAMKQRNSELMRANKELRERLAAVGVPTTGRLTDEMLKDKHQGTTPSRKALGSVQTTENVPSHRSPSDAVKRKTARFVNTPRAIGPQQQTAVTPTSNDILARNLFGEDDMEENDFTTTALDRAAATPETDAMRRTFSDMQVTPYPNKRIPVEEDNDDDPETIPKSPAVDRLNRQIDGASSKMLEEALHPTDASDDDETIKVNIAQHHSRSAHFAQLCATIWDETEAALKVDNIETTNSQPKITELRDGNLLENGEEGPLRTVRLLIAEVNALRHALETTREAEAEAEQRLADTLEQLEESNGQLKEKEDLLLSERARHERQAQAKDAAIVSLSNYLRTAGTSSVDAVRTPDKTGSSFAATAGLREIPGGVGMSATPAAKLRALGIPSPSALFTPASAGKLRMAQAASTTPANVKRIPDLDEAEEFDSGVVHSGQVQKTVMPDASDFAQTPIIKSATPRPPLNSRPQQSYGLSHAM